MRAHEPCPMGQRFTIRRALRERVVKIAVIVPPSSFSFMSRALEILDQLAEFRARTRDDLLAWFKKE